MSISTHVVGVTKPDGTFLKMKKIYDACQDVGIEIPDEVDDYFDGYTPNDLGLEVSLDDIVQEKYTDCYSIIEIKIANIPSKIEYIQVKTG